MTPDETPLNIVPGITKFELEYFDFAGGLNESQQVDSLRVDELAIARNMLLNSDGGVDIRGGFTNNATPTAAYAGPPIYIGEHRMHDGTSIKLLTMATNLMKWDGTVLLSGLATGSISGASFGDKFYFVDGATYRVYDGTTVATVVADPASAPLTAISRCTIVRSRGARLYFSGDPQNPNRLYFTEPGYTNYITTTDYIDAATNDGDVITGMEEFHDMLLVFQSHSVYALSNSTSLGVSTDLSFLRLDVPAGAANPHTIVRTDNEILFYGIDGIYALRGTYPDVIESRKISKDLQQTMPAVLHPELACAIFYGGMYILSLCTQAPVPPATPQNNIMAVLFYDIWITNLTAKGGAEPWVIWDGVKVAQLLKTFDGTLYAACADVGRIMVYNETVLTDNGAKINFEMETRPLNQGSVILQKKYKYVYLAARQFDLAITDYDVKLRVDSLSGENPVVIEVPADVSANDSFVWGISKWGEAHWGVSSLATRRIPVGLKGKRIFINITNSTANQPLSLYGLGIQCKYKKPGRY